MWIQGVIVKQRHYNSLNAAMGTRWYRKTPQWGCCLVAKFVWVFATPWTVAHQAPLSMGFPSKNTGVGCHFLLQGIFLTQGLNLCLLHWCVDPLPLNHLGSLLSEMLIFKKCALYFVVNKVNRYCLMCRLSVCRHWVRFFFLHVMHTRDSIQVYIWVWFSRR